MKQRTYPKRAALGRSRQVNASRESVETGQTGQPGPCALRRTPCGATCSQPKASAPQAHQHDNGAGRRTERSPHWQARSLFWRRGTNPPDVHGHPSVKADPRRRFFDAARAIDSQPGVDPQQSSDGWTAPGLRPFFTVNLRGIPGPVPGRCSAITQGNMTNHPNSEPDFEDRARWFRRLAVAFGVGLLWPIILVVLWGWLTR